MKFVPKILMTLGGLLLLFSVYILGTSGQVNNEADAREAITILSALLYLIPAGIFLVLIGFIIWFRRYIRKQLVK